MRVIVWLQLRKFAISDKKLQLVEEKLIEQLLPFLIAQITDLQESESNSYHSSSTSIIESDLESTQSSSFSTSSDKDEYNISEETSIRECITEKFGIKSNNETISLSSFIKVKEKFADVASSDKVREYIESIIRIELYKIFYIDVSKLPKPVFVNCLENEDELIDIMVNLISTNQNLFFKIVEEFIQRFEDYLGEHDENILYSDIFPPLFYEKKSDPIMSKVLPLKIILYIKKTIVDEDFIEKNLLKSCYSAIIFQSVHPLLRKPLNYYKLPLSLYNYFDKDYEECSIDDKLLNLEVFQTNDEMFDATNARFNFVDCLVNQDIMLEECTWNYYTKDELKTLFETCDFIFQDMINDCFQEAIEIIENVDKI